MAYMIKRKGIKNFFKRIIAKCTWPFFVRLFNTGIITFNEVDSWLERHGYEKPNK
jgi:hypothetical protein